MKTPTKREIVQMYAEITNLLANVTDLERLRTIANDEQLEIEVNGVEEGRWNEIERVEMVRVSHYRHLDYIYFFYEGHPTRRYLDNVMFDVWSDVVEDEFIMDCTLEQLDDKYRVGIEWLVN